MPLQKGQVVLLDGPGVRSSVSGQRGVLLERDAASGRYRVRLCAEPWKCTKVNRAAIHLVDMGQGESSGAEVGDQQAAEINFGEPPAKCDYSLGVHKKAQIHDLPAALKGMKTDWPLSPVRRGKVQDDRPLPHIQQVEQVDLYRSISQVTPHAPEDRHEVHRRRNYSFASVKDSELMDFTSVPGRKAPVQRGRPYKLLPQMDSRNLRAIVEEDHGAEINRKMEQTRNFSSVVPLKEHSLEIDHLREQEMDDRLDNLYRRAEEVKIERARREAEEKAEKEARAREEQEMDFSLSRGSAGSMWEQDRITEESEEERILREFQEYEAESPSHRATREGFAKDLSGLAEEEEGFEANKDDVLDFIPGQEFSGAKPGYVFKMDERGLGYYRDTLGGWGDASSAIVKKEEAWEEDFEVDPADAAEQPPLISKDNSLELGAPLAAPTMSVPDGSMMIGELDDVPQPPSFAPEGGSQAYIPQPPFALSDSASDIDELD